MRLRHGQLKRRLNRLTDDELSNLTTMIDKRGVRAMRVMTEMLLALKTSNDAHHQDVSAVLMYRMVELTLDLGIAPDSPVALSLLAMRCLSKKDDIDTAWRLVKIAKSLVERPGVQQTKLKTMEHSIYVAHWREPLSRLVDLAISIHTGGMQSGNLWSAAVVRDK